MSTNEANATAIGTDDVRDTYTPATTTTITEGSATMTFPATEESTVFYNPVQVQNRDLSILMITLYAERRAMRQALQSKRKELSSSKTEEPQRRLSKKQIEEQLQEYQKNELSNPMALIQGREYAAQSGLTILEALAASGLRSVRYWKEIVGVKHVTINDLELAAVERAKDNLQRNQLEPVLLLESNEDRRFGICVNHGDATHELYIARRPQQTREPTPTQLKQQPMWDVIDLDPYGSAAPFLDGAVQAVESGGLLCITCTDMAALGGSHPETAFGRYAALPIQSARYLQELALRILLHTVAVSAARYGRTIRPILSVGMAFYVRIFVEVHDDKKGVQELSLRLGHVYQSTQCPSFVTMPHSVLGGKKGNVYQSVRVEPSTCPETGAHFKVGGPLWLGPLHDPEVVQTALERLEHESGSSPKMEWIATRKRLQGLLTSVADEIETPLYYTVPSLAKVLHCACPPLQKVKAAISNAGYKVSGFHKEPEALKTDAPGHVVWDVMRVWAKENPPKKPLPEGSAGAKIMAVEPSIQVNFTIPDVLLEKQKEASNISRFPQNPQRHWGPKRKASNKRSATDEDDTSSPQDMNVPDSEEPPVKKATPSTT